MTERRTIMFDAAMKFRVLIIRKWLVAFLYLTGANFAFAQAEFRLGASLVFPTQDMSDIYNPTPGFSFTFMRNIDKKNHRTNYGIHFGVVSFQSPGTWAYTQHEAKTHIWILYGNYQRWQVNYAFRYDLVLHKKFEVYFGAGVGLHLLMFDYKMKADMAVGNGDGVEIRTGLWPCLGLNLKATSTLGFYLQARYDALIDPIIHFHSPLHRPDKDAVSVHASAEAGLFFKLRRQ